MSPSKSPALFAALLVAALTAGIVGVRLWIGNPAAGGGPPSPPPVFPDGPEGGALRILHGADRAFERGEYRPAFDFYRGWELRQAGSAAHEANVERVLDRVLACGERLGEPKEPLQRYLAHRRKLHKRWLDCKGKPAGPELRVLLDVLPDEDGRRARIESMIGGK